MNSNIPARLPDRRVAAGERNKIEPERMEEMIDPYTRADPSPMTEVVMYQTLIRRPMTKQNKYIRIKQGRVIENYQTVQR